MGIKEKKKRVSTAESLVENYYFIAQHSVHLRVSLNVTEEIGRGAVLWKLEDPTSLVV